MFEDAAGQVSRAFDDFVATSLDARFGSAEVIEEEAARNAVALFREVADTVPAYRALLAEHHVRPESVESIADFSKLPLVTREGYLRKHALPALTRGGRLEACDMIAVSSGSTGEPGFWPRATADELSVAVRFEQVFRDGFRAHTRSTLAVVCFALGTWVGGMFTAAACRHLANKGYPLTVVTPGNVPDEIFRVLRGLAPHFDQTVLLGYPPFLKDVIDRGRAAGIPWADLQLKLVTAGEVFSETWRSLVAERGHVMDPRFDIASLYGTADAGVLGNETPLSVVIRRYLNEKPELARELFGSSRLPTLAQYDPRDRYFEVEGGRLVFSGMNGIPLVRYAIGDEGGLIRYRDMLARLLRDGFDPLSVLHEAAHVPRELPFVYVFGRTHFAVSFFGANVFPETIALGLEQPEIAPFVTGKFVLEAKEGDASSAAHMSLGVELAPGVGEGAIEADVIAEVVLAQLLRTNSELKAYAPAQYQKPRVHLHPCGDPQWFPVGVKHRYTRR